jgi:hypothetical protein
MSLRNLFVVLCAVMLAVQPLSAVERGNGILYVNSQQHELVQDGKSWKTAYSDLQDALTEAENNFNISKIKIACGVYKPSKTYSPKDVNQVPVVAGAFSLPQYNPGITNDGIFLNYADDPAFYNGKLRTFQLIDGVDLIGGYRVKGNSGPCCQTILDGNLGTEANPDKVWHVLTAGNDITIEGVSCNLVNITLQNGDAIPAPYFPITYPLNPGEVPVYYHDDGAGLYVTCKSFINLDKVTIQNSKGVAGGGVYADDGSIIHLRCCRFNDNEAYDGAAAIIRSGGAHDNVDYDHRISTMTLDNCTFSRNHSFVNGTLAAYDNYFPEPNLGPNLFVTQCHFKDLPEPDESGVFVIFTSNFQLIDSTIDNSLQGGLGIYLAEITFAKVSGSTFIKCQSPFSTINMNLPRILNNSVQIDHCTFVDNFSESSGGAIKLASPGGYPILSQIKDNLFLRNTSLTRGGAIFLENVVGLNNFCAENEFEGNSAPLGPNLFAEPNVYLPAPCTTF